MSLNWIKVEEYSFNSLLLMERFQLRILLEAAKQEEKLSEIFRVVKSGGWVLDCPGEERRKREPEKELLRYGFEEFHYVSSLGGDVYRYRKQIFKAD